MTIYVGNLSHQAGEQELYELFAEFGAISSAKVVRDSFSGQSRGFAFVEIAEQAEAEAAIAALHETEFMQRTIIVNEAKPRTNTRPGGGGRGGFNNRGGGGGGRGGYNNRY
ncbi:RNA recognition motif domain-containing protein [Chitinophaga defluvii]|uniref:RNA-binding protein n=1 Tax=Chitinophaga defluvii TaxID=3163343 RepID=A0ABV2T645_9BACT